MEPVRNPRVKICCIQSVVEARIAVRQGASALGLVSAMPSGPGVISEDRIAEIVASVPPPVATFLLTCATQTDMILRQQRRTRANTLQLCDRVSADVLTELRGSLPGIALVQVIHVTGPESLDEAVEVAPYVDALLLDSGNPSLPIKQLGGTGRRHDWNLSQQIREAVSVPLFLAGGLTAANVSQAIAEVGPFGLDVCSGVRTDDKLDAEKLARFVAAL